MPATDIERALSPPVGAISPTMRTFPHPRDDDDVSAHELDEHEPEPIPIVPLKQSSTVLSTRSARDAARALESFESSPENPRNWTTGRKWRTTLTVALTGFISTCGSSIAVPGVHSVMAEFGEHNTKIGVLITSFYVLGLGWVVFVVLWLTKALAPSSSRRSPSSTADKWRTIPRRRSSSSSVSAQR